MNVFMMYVDFVANILAIISTSIAIYIYIFKRKSVATIFNLLINYTYQLSLSELKEKLEKLNDYNAKNAEENIKIVYILNDIVGQIKGNTKLKKHFSENLEEIENYASSKRKLTEPKKRAIVSEIRERLRNLNVKNIDHLIGGNN